MKKIFKSLVLFSVFLFVISSVSAIRLPTSQEKNWASSSIYGLEKWLLESHTANGTLKTDMNLSANDFNVSNNLIVTGNIKGEIPDAFKKLNWSNLYVAEANTRYSLTNFTSNYDTRADRFGNINFTNVYDGRNDRWLLSNFTASFANRLNELWKLGNFTLAYDDRVDRFGNQNFTTRYDLRNDRYSKENFTAQIAQDGLFTLANYSAEYSLTGYKLLNFTSNYDVRTDRFSILNGTNLPFSKFTIENGTTLPFSNFKIENVSKSEQNPSNETIFLPSQEKVDGLKSADSPKFTAINVTDVRILTGSGDPEASVTAPRGSLYLRTNGTFYVKENGVSNTGWIAK